MTRSIQRLAVTAPGHMKSQITLRDQKHPRCTLQHFDLDDLDQTMCDILADEEKRLQARSDPQSFQLQVQFVRTHGLPRGEVTTLSIGGIGSSSLDRHR